MRQTIILLVTILIAVALYTAYGLITFEPDPAPEFTFAAPVIPPEVLTAQATSADSQKQTDAAMDQLSQAITVYQGYEKNSSPQAVSTFALINTAVLNGRLPGYLISAGKNASGKRDFEMITTDPKRAVNIPSGQSNVDCGQGFNAAEVMVGDNGDNKLTCEAEPPPRALDRVFLGGPGNDSIINTLGNSIINAGTGDDAMTLGKGRAIILLDDAWGKDTVTVDCSQAKVDMAGDIMPGFPIPWVQPYANFILLSPRINPADVEWNGLVLTNKTTGDTLSVSEKCFNLVSAGQASTQ